MVVASEVEAEAELDLAHRRVGEERRGAAEGRRADVVVRPGEVDVVRRVGRGAPRIAARVSAYREFKALGEFVSANVTSFVSGRENGVSCPPAAIATIWRPLAVVNTSGVARALVGSRACQT